MFNKRLFREKRNLEKFVKYGKFIARKCFTIVRQYSDPGNPDQIWILAVENIKIIIKTNQW